MFMKKVGLAATTAALAAGAVATGASSASAAETALHCQYLVTRPLAVVWTTPGADRELIKYKHPGDGVISPDRCDAVTNGFVRVELGGGGSAWMARNMLNRGLTRPEPPVTPWLNTPTANSYWSNFRTVAPAPGTDYGRLVTWHRASDGRVLFEEDRVTIHYDAHSPSRHSNAGYTNVNKQIRRYYLAPDVQIQVDDLNYRRLTGHFEYFDGLRQVSRLQFLYGYVTSPDAYNRSIRDDTGYRIFFNAAHDTITKIQAIAIPET